MPYHSHHAVHVHPPIDRPMPHRPRETSAALQCPPPATPVQSATHHRPAPPLYDHFPISPFISKIDLHISYAHIPFPICSTANSFINTSVRRASIALCTIHLCCNYLLDTRTPPPSPPVPPHPCLTPNPPTVSPPWTSPNSSAMSSRPPAPRPSPPPCTPSQPRPSPSRSSFRPTHHPSCHPLHPPPPPRLLPTCFAPPCLFLRPPPPTPLSPPHRIDRPRLP